MPTLAAPTELSSWLVRRLNCAACHSRDGAQAALPEIALEEGSVGQAPDPLPSLTWTGEKLQPPWVRAFLKGEVAWRPRPWLPARMPSFPAYADALAVGLAAEHGLAFAHDADDPHRQSPDLNARSLLIKQGERLTFKAGGLDCRQCHAPSSELLKLENKSQGVGLAYIVPRLRREYYDRWMYDPLRVDPLTKMPKFSADGKRTQAAEILDGDAAAQFAALWEYLRSQAVAPVVSPAGN